MRPKGNVEAPPRLTRRAESIRPSPTLAISRTLDAMRQAGREVVDLGVGEPDFPTPDFVKRAGIGAIEGNKTRYTDTPGEPALREAVAAKFRARDAAIDGSRVVISAGGKQSLFNACQVLFQEGDEVLFFSPYWVSFPEMVRLSAASPVVVPSRAENAFRPRLEDILPFASENSRGLILNSPNNPTGAAIDAGELAKILDWARERGIFVIFDECYEFFLYEDRRHASPTDFWERHGENVLISGAASKTYAMTGWRLGWAVGPKPVIAAMSAYQSHSTSNASSIAQEAALAALSDHERSGASVQAMLREYGKRRARIVAALNAVEGVRCPAPDGAFYAFADVSALYPRARVAGSVEFSKRLLETAGVATIPGAAFGEDRYIRFSFAAAGEEIDKGMRLFATFAARL